MKQTGKVLGPLGRKGRAQGHQLLLVGMINLTLMQPYAAAAPTVITGQTIDTSASQATGVSVNAGDVVHVTHSSVTTRGYASAALRSEGTL
uniref:hypothetical protein n=1 Tax=Pseudomonas viridiflava TaxID=33069 RepID=UPI0019CFEF84